MDWSADVNAYIHTYIYNYLYLLTGTGELLFRFPVSAWNSYSSQTPTNCFLHGFPQGFRENNYLLFPRRTHPTATADDSRQQLTILEEAGIPWSKEHIRPHFNYCDTVYDGHITINDATRLETLQNRSGRLVTGTLFRTSTDKLLLYLGWNKYQLEDAYTN